MNESLVRPNFFARAMRHHWILVTAVLIIGALAAAGSVVSAKPSYSSTSIVFLDPLAGNPYSPSTPTSRTEQLAALTTEAGLVYTDAVANSALAIAKAAHTTLGTDIRNNIVTEVPSNSTVIQITFTASDPKVAQAGAQALAEAYLGYRKARATTVVNAQNELRKQQQASITKLLADASTKLNAAKASTSTATSAAAAAADAAQIVDLQQQVTLYAGQLATVNLEQTAADATSITPGDIISPATLPSAKNGVNPLLIALAIFLCAMALSVVAALARENVDQRVRDEHDFAGTGVRPVRGIIRPWRHHGETKPDEEGFRRLANILSAAQGEAGQVMLLAATPGGADTLTVAQGLATAFGETATDAVIVEAVSPKGGGKAPLTPGLTDILDGKLPLADVWGLLDSQNGRATLPVGTEAARLAELVQGPTMGKLLRELARRDAVVLVAGSSLEAGIGVALARHTASVLLVVDGRTARVADLATSRDLIEQIHAELAGAVLVHKPSRRNHRHVDVPPVPVAEPDPKASKEPAGGEVAEAGAPDVGEADAQGPGKAGTADGGKADAADPADPGTADAGDAAPDDDTVLSRHGG